MDRYDSASAPSLAEAVEYGQTSACGLPPPLHDATHWDESAKPLAMRLAAYCRARRALFDWMHPTRLARLPCATQLGALDGVRGAALAEAVLSGAGYAVPVLSLFEPVDAALVRLPPLAVLTVFRLRALLDFADQVQGWIDRPRRAWLAGWVGAAGARLLLARRRELTGRSTLMPRAVRAAVLDENAGDMLAWRGLQLFRSECRWRPDAPLAMLELALPAGSAESFAPPAAPAAIQPLAGAAMPHAPSLAIVEQLPVLFPEATW